MSDAAVVEWCVSRGLERVYVRGADVQLFERLQSAGLTVEVGGSVTDVDAALWLRDSASVAPRPHLAGGVRHGGLVLVEASLMPSGPEPIPVEVEHERVSLVVGDGDRATRIEFVGDTVSTTPIAVWDLDQLDAHLRGEGCRLEERAVDWYGGAVKPTSPCHLSWFRNLGVEPR